MQVFPGTGGVSGGGVCHDIVFGCGDRPGDAPLARAEEFRGPLHGSAVTLPMGPQPVLGEQGAPGCLSHSGRSLDVVRAGVSCSSRFQPGVPMGLKPVPSFLRPFKPHLRHIRSSSPSSSTSTSSSSSSSDSASSARSSSPKRKPIPRGEPGCEEQVLLPSYFFDPVQAPLIAATQEQWFSTDQWLDIVTDIYPTAYPIITFEEQSYSILIFTPDDFEAVKSQLALRLSQQEAQKKKDSEQEGDGSGETAPAGEGEGFTDKEIRAMDRGEKPIQKQKRKRPQVVQASGKAELDMSFAQFCDMIGAHPGTRLTFTFVQSKVDRLLQTQIGSLLIENADYYPPKHRLRKLTPALTDSMAHTILELAEQDNRFTLYTPDLIPPDPYVLLAVPFNPSVELMWFDLTPMSSSSSTPPE